MIAQVTHSLNKFGGKFAYRLKECPIIIRIDYFLFFVFRGIIVSIFTTIVRIRGIVACILPFRLLVFLGGVITLLYIKIPWIFLDIIGWSLWLPAPSFSEGPIINRTIALFLHRGYPHRLGSRRSLHRLKLPFLFVSSSSV